MRYLHTRQSTLLIRDDVFCPHIVYFGPKLEEPQDPAALAVLLEPAIIQGGIDEQPILSIAPSYADPTFMNPAIRIHQDRQGWAPQWQIKDVNSDQTTLSYRLVDPKTGLELRWTATACVENDVFSFDVDLIQTGDQQVSLEQWLTTLPVPTPLTKATTFTGRWIQEFQPRHHQIDFGTLEFTNLKGRTSHDHFPGVILSSRQSDETHGECLGLHLGWSGNHCQRIERSQNGLTQYQAGVAFMPGEMVLKPGDTFTAPTLYATYSTSGLAGIAEHFQSFVRNHILTLTDKPRPVHINTWEALYFDHDQTALDSLAKAAHQVGAERYVLDDGWFPARRNDTAGLGDWVIDTQVYPDGFTPLIKTLNEQQLSFGLWFEPEMVNEDSQLFRDHPEWVLAIDGQVQAKGRNQWVLDITRKEVQEYLLNQISNLLRDHPIEYIKWDMNRDLLQAGNAQGTAAYYDYVNSLYHLLDELRERFPQVEIESCSSGGGRMDYGILRYTQRFWLSDCNDAHERQIMQQWASLFFPVEVLGSHIGPTYSHTTSRSHPLPVRAGTALFAHMGIEWDVREATNEEQQQLANCIGLYKEWRHFIHSQIRRPMTGSDENQIAFYVGNADTQLISVFQREVPVSGRPVPLRLNGLINNADYSVSLLLQPEHTGHLMKRKPAWMTKPEEGFQGNALMQIGLPLPILDPESLIVIKVEKR
ncbi:alpha-galactosidase [Reinekea blandensis]|uniref:Alpha-galactosidase n=1 Tax=Reinekea blandensis MED297 TaxID=314283 RepID=A4BEG2_9GAMM|nr:alpha-galactosidase [Reinekea blandensis]EAR09389.1 alpha-galactosidase [Reinekea sp. MED297] [Reinekea blandensis MED297]